MRRWFLSTLLLLQAVALAFAADQKILVADDANAQATKPEPAAQTDVGPSEHHAWDPYQNGKSRALH
ncbi:hypothetical protein F5B18DRAFT_648065 [Nemania serpens]|nr:hypothetical protein F5B18DRAFT_648065 [Nemania serpens]